MADFLSMAGHELKTPLTAMLLSIRMLQRSEEQGARPMAGGNATPAETSSGGLLRQHRRLSRLVNDLLDVSRIQAGRVELRLEWADLATIVREAVEEQRQIVPAHPLLLRLPPDFSVPLFIDAGRIRQIVTNYLTNALKYSSAAFPVEVGIHCEAGQVQVWVRDQGPGLSAEAQEHIWDRFYRAKGVEVQDGSGMGLGLGLYICRILIALHRGQVGVTSAPGKGSTFWLTLPLEEK